MSTNPKDVPATKFLLREPVRGILLEDDLSAIPREVEAANTEAVRAWEKHQDAVAQLRDARAEQKLVGCQVVVQADLVRAARWARVAA